MSKVRPVIRSVPNCVDVHLSFILSITKDISKHWGENNYFKYTLIDVNC